MNVKRAESLISRNRAKIDECFAAIEKAVKAKNSEKATKLLNRVKKLGLQQDCLLAEIEVILELRDIVLNQKH